MKDFVVEITFVVGVFVTVLTLCFLSYKKEIKTKELIYQYSIASGDYSQMNEIKK